MSGLQVKIVNSNQSLNNVDNFNNIGQITTQGCVAIFTVGSPQDLAGVISEPSTTLDSKAFLRQNKKDLFIHNQGAPGWIRLVHFRVRRNITLANYSSFTNLLGDQNLTITNWAAPLTTGNPAQRYLKFGKTRMIKVNQGGTCHLKLNLKMRPRLVTFDVEMDTTFLATRLTKGFILQWIPCPVQRLNNLATPTSYTGLAPAGYQVDILEQDYLSYYNIAENDPTAIMSNLAAATGQINSCMFPGYQRSAISTASP